MKRHLRLTTAAAVAVVIPLASGGVLSAAGAARTAPTAPTRTTYQPPDIEWGPCSGLSLPSLLDSYTCALYPVPLDHRQPDGQTIDLALIKREATVPDQRLGTLFFNPGGPGASGVDAIASQGSLETETVRAGGDTPELLFDASVLAAYDVIGFDPRGIARSASAKCFDGSEDPARYVDFFFGYPDLRSELRSSAENTRRFDKRCQELAGPIRDNMSSTDVAIDLEILRQAVNDPLLNYAGYSYGTFIGSVYANMFPDRVGAMVLDGVLDPVDWATGDTPGEGNRVPTAARVGSDVGSQASLEQFFRLCDEAGPQACAFAPDSGARFDALYEKLRREPVVPSLFNVVNHQSIASFALGGLYTSTQWQFMAAELAYIEAVAAERPVQRVTAAAGKRQRFEAGFLPFTYFADEQFLGVVCSDGARPASQRAWVAAEKQAVGYIGPIWAWSDRGCQNWTGRDNDRFTGPFTSVTANPVLIASTRFDPATPYENAQVLHELMPDSILLTVDGYGHTTPKLSQCADDSVTAYLLRQPMASTEIECRQDIDVFPAAIPSTDSEADEPAPDVVTGALVETSPEVAELADALDSAGDDDRADALRLRQLYVDTVLDGGLSR